MTDRISLLISAKNLSAAQFADEIGVQRSSISHLMSGRNKPSLDLIQKTLQRFPEVSTEWLLFGKGEMVRSLNLFDSKASSAGLQANMKPASEAAANHYKQEREPTLFTEESQETEQKNEHQEEKNTENTSDTARESITRPAPGLAENMKFTSARKESGEDSEQVTNTKSSKKECAIDQIIVFYNDRTFIVYSPGN